MSLAHFPRINAAALIALCTCEPTCVHYVCLNTLLPRIYIYVCTYIRMHVAMLKDSLDLDQCSQADGVFVLGCAPPKGESAHLSNPTA